MVILNTTHRRDTKEQQFKIFILFFLITLSIFQQMPIVKELYYNEIRILLFFLFGIFSIYSLKYGTQYKNINFFMFFVVVEIYILIMSIVFLYFTGKTLDILELLIPLGILICSLTTNFEKKQIKRLLLWYTSLAMVLGVTSVLYYNQNFSISALYSIPNKNQVGPILGIATIIIGVLLINYKKKGHGIFLFLYRVSVFFMLVYSILVFRNRASILAIIITLFCYIFMNYRVKLKYKNLVLFQSFLLLFFILLVFGGLKGVVETFWNSFTLNFDVTDLNSLSANRTDIYSSALQFSIENPIFGELGGADFMATPHNYILNKWVNYGIIISLPIILLYLYLWIYTIKKLFFEKSQNGSLPLWVLFFSLLTSIFEYTFPYGPGVSQIMVWFLLGQYLKQQYKE